MKFNFKESEANPSDVRWVPRASLLIYPGAPDSLLENFTSNLWSGYAQAGVTEILSNNPSFEQLLAAMVVKCDLYPLNIHIFNFSRDVRRLNRLRILDSINLGIKLEALGFSKRAELVPNPAAINSSITIYEKMDAVRSLARVKRCDEASETLKALHPSLNEVSYYCLLAEILFAKKMYKQLIAALKPYKTELLPRYLRFLGRAYARVPGESDHAIDILESLPGYDYYRMHNLPRLKDGKSIDSIYWRGSLPKRSPEVFEFLRVVKPLEVAFEKCTHAIRSKGLAPV